MALSYYIMACGNVIKLVRFLIGGSGNPTVVITATTCVFSYDKCQLTSKVDAHNAEEGKLGEEKIC